MVIAVAKSHRQRPSRWLRLKRRRRAFVIRSRRGLRLWDIDSSVLLRLWLRVWLRVGLRVGLRVWLRGLLRILSRLLLLRALLRVLLRVRPPGLLRLS